MEQATGTTEEAGPLALPAADVLHLTEAALLGAEALEEQADQAEEESPTLEAFGIDGRTVTPQEFAAALRVDVARTRAIVAAVRAELKAAGA